MTSVPPTIGVVASLHQVPQARDMRGALRLRRRGRRSGVRDGHPPGFVGRVVFHQRGELLQEIGVWKAENCVGRGAGWRKARRRSEALFYSWRCFRGSCRSQ